MQDQYIEDGPYASIDAGFCRFEKVEKHIEDDGIITKKLDFIST
jgi:hypothetical protein